MNRRFSKLWVPLVLIAMLLVAGCNSASTQTGGNGSESGAEKSYTIGVFMSNAGDPYFQNKSYGYFQGAKLLEATNPGVSINIEMFNAGGYEQVEKQIAQVEDAIQRNVDAIIITATNGEALIPVIDKAMAAGIPVINDDVFVNTTTTTRISENSYRVGQNAMAHIARTLNGEGNVVMIKGPAGAMLFSERARGAEDEVKRFAGLNIIGEQWSDVNIVEGQRLMEDWIQAHGKNIDAVWSTNTVAAMGAVQALQAAGFNPGDVKVVSVDLHDEGMQLMRDGWITAIVPAQPVKLASMSVQYAYKAILGEEVPEQLYTTDDMAVDAEMLRAFDLSDAMSPAGWQPPLK